MKNVYYLYRYNEDKVDKTRVPALSSCWSGEFYWHKLKNESLWQFLMRVIRSVSWFVFAYGTLRVYIVKGQNNEKIHISYMCTRSYKFPFLQDNDYYIGPCFTDEKYRGQGIYGAVLLKIIEDNPDANNFYMIIHQENISSQRGASRVGFEVIGKIKKEKTILGYKWCRNE